MTITILKHLVLIILTVLLGECAWTVHVLRPRLIVTIDNIDRTVIIAGAAATNVEKGAREWERASKEQAKQTTKAAASMASAANKLTSFVVRTDESINSQIIPRLSTVLEQQSLALLQTQLDLQANLKEILVTTQQLQKTLADADAQITNPSIQKSLDNLSVASENMSEATGHLANITADGEKTADYYAKKLTTPQSFIKTVALLVLRLGSETRILLNK